LNKYKILLLIICLFVQLSSTAETLQCGVEKTWNVDSAREETFKNMQPWIDLSWAPSIDPNLIENKQAINNHQDYIKNRSVTQYSDGAYSVWILDNDNYDKSYYYIASGELVAIDFSIFPENIKNLQDFLVSYQKDSIYPIKVYKHAYPSGKIISIDLTVLTAKGDEEYMFKPSGELDFHWIGNNGYDVNGRKILTRKGYQKQRR